MKKEEWNAGLDHLDQALVEKYVLQRDALEGKKQRRAIRLRVGTLAACLLLTVGAIIAVPMLRRDSSQIIPEPPTDGVTNDYGADSEPISNTDSGLISDKDPEKDPPGGTEDKTENGDFAFIVEIHDAQYQNYQIPGFFCAPKDVGEFFGELTVTLRYGTDTAYISANAYKVVGVDSELCLCIRYNDDLSNELYRDHFELDQYYFLYAKEHRFSSLDDLRSIITEGTLRLPEDFSYYKTLDGELCQTGFRLPTSVSEELCALLLSLDGDGLDTNGGALQEGVHAQSAEYVTGYLSFQSKIGYISGYLNIYESGYLYFSPFGGQLFDIKQAAAREIIDRVIASGEDTGYLWTEIDGTRYPFVLDESASYATLREALTENKLYGQLSFSDEVFYRENCFQGDPLALCASEDTLSAIAEILYNADGQAVKTDEIPGYALLFSPTVAVNLVHLESKVKCGISVYDSGHVELNGDYFFIGKDDAENIVALVLACRADQID